MVKSFMSTLRFVALSGVDVMDSLALFEGENIIEIDFKKKISQN